MIDFLSPLRSLQQGHWFKLICGASFQHLPAIRTLTTVYALAGADCIDVAADPAIVSTAREAIAIANHFSHEAHQRGYKASLPWLMVSLNDGEDPHFRKAEFDAAKCPVDCTRPCEAVCPADAIVFNSAYAGVINDRCYGCGRCLPICPIGQIAARSYVYTPDAISPMLLQAGIDAIEIHTQVGRFADFARLWSAIAPWTNRLKLVAISCPDGDGLIDYLWALHDLISPLPCALIWQTDGRPMSGDIGDGATRACVKLGQKVLSADLPGYIQLAGGTNRHTIPKLEALGMLHNKNSTIARSISGIAYGSYARSLLTPILNQLEPMEKTLLSVQSIHPSVSDHATSFVDSVSTAQIEMPDLLWQAVDLAAELVNQLKSLNRRQVIQHTPEIHQDLIT